MSDAHIIELTVPGLLQFRDVAMRVIMESCKLVGRLDTASGDQARAEAQGDEDPASLPEHYDFEDQFTLEFTSAFSEIYNNIPIHAYEGKGHGTIGFKILIGHDHLMVDITDTGKSFDIDAVPPPENLPMRGMGIHIARTMLDNLEYESGPPNRWRLVKYVGKSRKQSPSSEASATK